MFSAVSCVKQKQYPNDSVLGANIFGVMINDKPLLPCVSLFNNGTAIQSNSQPYPNNYWRVNVSMKNKCDKSYDYGRYVSVTFDSLDIHENKVYKLWNAFSNKRSQVLCYYSEELKEFGSDSTLSGTILVRKFDPINKIISASFEAILKEKTSNQTVYLTNGKYDVKF